MKTRLCLIPAVLLFLCAACATPPPVTETETPAPQPTEPPPAAPDPAPLWAQATQLANQHYENPSLVIGDA